MKRRSLRSGKKQQRVFKPKRLPFEDNPPPEPLQAWRIGSFFLTHNPEDAGFSVIVDVDEQTFIRHVGHFDEVVAMLNALQSLRFQGEYLYSTDVFDLSDEEFIKLAMPAMMNMEELGHPEPDFDPDTLFDLARDSLIDTLLKKPDKKN